MTGPHFAENPETLVPDAAEMRAALARLLAAERFAQSQAQLRLLQFAVAESLAGRRCKLKKSPADQLRARLQEYYAAEGARDPVRIHIPVDGSAPVFSVAPVAQPVSSESRRRLWIWLPAALAVAGLLVWAGTWWHARTASAAIRSIAILPFVDNSPQKPGDWLAEGMTGELIDSLTRVSGLQVVAPPSAFAFKGTAADLHQAGQQLGVAAVIEGRVSQTGDRLRVTLQMSRVSDGYHLWASSFDRPSQDVLGLMQSLAVAIAGRVQMPLPKGASSHQPSPEAYAAYLQGRYFFHRTTNAGDRQNLDKAIERLETSTRTDPELARAWAWLSIAREYRVASGMARSNRGMPASRDAAERAVALDPDSGEAHLALGIVKLQYDWDWAAAKTELDRALEANPGSAFALRWRAHWYEAQGRMDDAISEMKRALVLDPLSGITLGDLAGQYLSIHQVDRALPLEQKVVELDPDDAASRATQAELLFLAGQSDQSAQILTELHNSPAGGRVPAWMFAFIAAQQGDAAGAREMLNQAEDLPEDQLFPAIAYAQLAAAVQDWDRFFLWLDEAYGERDVQLPYLRTSPIRPKSDPRFDAFLAQMNLPAEPAK